MSVKEHGSKYVVKSRGESEYEVFSVIDWFTWRAICTISDFTGARIGDIFRNAIRMYISRWFLRNMDGHVGLSDWTIFKFVSEIQKANMTNDVLSRLSSAKSIVPYIVVSSFGDPESAVDFLDALSEDVSINWENHKSELKKKKSNYGRRTRICDKCGRRNFIAFMIGYDDDSSGSGYLCRKCYNRTDFTSQIQCPSCHVVFIPYDKLDAFCPDCRVKVNSKEVWRVKSNNLRAIVLGLVGDLT